MAVASFGAFATAATHASLARMGDLTLAPALPASIPYEPGVTDLPDQARPILDGVAAAMRLDEGLQIVLTAYATGKADRPEQARHISLVRATYIRIYLMEHGIASTRIDVRGLGSHADGGAGDRVDISAIEP